MSETNSETMATIMNKMEKEIFTLSRVHFYYRQWFSIYGDPLSDDIMLDIQQQAYEWAKLHAVQLHSPEFRVGDLSQFIGLSRKR